MIFEIKVPSPGESVTSAVLSRLLVANGSFVDKDAEIAEIDSDKATLPIYASESGVLTFLANEGDTVMIGAVIAKIDSANTAPTNDNQPVQTASKPINEESHPAQAITYKIKISPLAKQRMMEAHISEEELIKQVVKERYSTKEVNGIITARSQSASPINSSSAKLNEERTKMSPLRKKLSERLVYAKNQTAMLTTFNEINMSKVVALRSKYKEAVKEKYGFPLGYMSFFTKAVSIALAEYPAVNNMIDGDDIIINKFMDISIAVSTPKGLMVPVVRGVEKMNLIEIEKSIFELAQKAKNNRISLDDMTGGTFTITNGGVFGSLLSTPIINTPQSAILGMHNIVDRPIAVAGKVEIHPMMYIALSYDHRIIDGRESVGFLVKVKALIEDPEILLPDGI